MLDNKTKEQILENLDIYVAQLKANVGVLTDMSGNVMEHFNGVLVYNTKTGSVEVKQEASHASTPEYVYIYELTPEKYSMSTKELYEDIRKSLQKL